MKLKKLLLNSACVLVFLLEASANASPINWVLQGVTFDDGGTLSGTFSTDSVSGSLLSFDLTTTAGSVFSGFHYDISNSSLCINCSTGAPIGVAIEDSLQDRYLNLHFNNPLTLGGVDILSTNNSFEFECVNCSSANVRNILTGNATTQTVPEPTTVWLLGAGLLGLMGVARCKAT